MAGPLSAVRVIDLTSVVSGPFATMFLADQGADVIKVEPPGGDITRRSRQSVDPTGQFSALFISTNRGKRSLSIDLKQPEGIEILKKLIARSDVLVQNFRPQVMDRLGLGEAAMRALNPRLIYVSISGAGDSGPYAEKRIYDPIIQGLSGFADVQSNPETRAPADDPDHRRRQDHLGFYRPGGRIGPVRAGKDGRGPAHQGGDARHHDLLSLAGSHDAVHGGRPGGCGERPQGAARSDLQDARRLHDRRHDLGLRMAGLLPRRRAAGADRGQEVQHAGRAHRQRRRAHQPDGRHPRQAHHGRLAEAPRRRRRAVRTGAAPRRGDAQRAGGGARPDRRVRPSRHRSRAPGQGPLRSSAARRPERLRRRRRSASTAARFSPSWVTVGRTSSAWPRARSCGCPNR